jgi:nitrite reductase (NO-forming)
LSNVRSQVNALGTPEVAIAVRYRRRSALLVDGLRSCACHPDLTRGPNTLDRVGGRVPREVYMNTSKTPDRNWWARNAGRLKTVFRVVIGVIWAIDGFFKFTSGYTGSFLGDVQNSQSGAPGWLNGWYSFWVTQATHNGTAIVYTVGVFETLLGIALILGFMRKIAYIGGVVLSLLIWAIPEGFGGPYGAGTGATDIGTGIIYAMVFFGLIVINSTYGPSRWSVDNLIERRFPRWASVAEFGGVRALPPAVTAPAG